MKKLLLLLGVLCSAVLWAHADEATFSISSSKINGSTSLTSVTNNDITLAFAKGGGSNAPALSSTYLKFYGGNTLSVSGTNTNVVISNIKITTNSGNNGKLTATNWSANCSNNVWTITPTSATTSLSSTTIQNGENSSQAQARITNIVVTYSTKTNVTLTWSSATATGDAAKSADFAAPSLSTDPADAASEVVFSSDDTAVATVDSKSGAVTLVNEGETKIWAKISNSTTYNDASASYTLTVTDSAVKVTIPTISTEGNKVILSADENCSIYYTVDGSEPTKVSTPYTTPFYITQDCTVKAIAYDADGNPSKVSNLDVTYLHVATPTFDPASTFVEPGTTVSIATATEGATIYYYINDATEAKEYTAPLTITEATTIKAFAKADHYGDSETATQSYQLGNFVAMKSTLTVSTFGVSGTSYREYKYEDQTVGAKYSGYINTNSTKDYIGMRPYESSSKKGGGIVTVTSPGYVKSVTLTQYSGYDYERDITIYGSHSAYKQGLQSDATTDCFGTKLATKTLSKGNPVTIDLSSLSEQYEYIAIAGEKTCQLSSIEITWNVLKEVGAVVVNAPKITNDGNLVTITPADDDNKDNTVIYYSTDGNDPTAASTKYEAPFSISEACTVKAIAYVGEVSSDIASATLAYATVATPTLSISSDAVLKGQAVTVACATDNATILYAFGDNEFAAYTDALTINEATTLKVKATRENYADSDVATAEYTIGTPVVYTLVTSTKQLTDGAQYLIANYKDDVIMGKYNNKNFFPTTAFAKDGNTLSVAEGATSVNVVTFLFDSDDNAWNLKTGLEGQYLAANSSNSNDVTLTNTPYTNTGEISSFDFAEDGQLLIKFNNNDEGARNCFNYGGTYFSCFVTERNVKLYKLGTDDDDNSGDNGDDTPEVETGTIEFTFSADDDQQTMFEKDNFMISSEGSVTDVTNNGNYVLITAESYPLTIVGDREVKGISKVEVIGYSASTYYSTVYSTLSQKCTATIVEGNEDKVGSFKVKEGNAYWTAPEGNLASSVEIVPESNNVYIQSVNVTWSWVTPVIKDLQKDNETLSFSVKNGHQVKYLISGASSANAPARIVATDEMTTVTEDSEGWVIDTDTNSYMFDMTSLSKDQTISIAVTNGHSYSATQVFNLTTSGIEDVATDSLNAEAVYYNLQGQPVANPAAGLYIRVQGNRAEKVAIR